MTTKETPKGETQSTGSSKTNTKREAHWSGGTPDAKPPEGEGRPGHLPKE